MSTSRKGYVSDLHRQCDEVRQKDIDWEAYFKKGFISEEDSNCMIEFHKNPRNFLAEHMRRLILCWINLLTNCNRKAIIQHVLVLINYIVKDDRTVIDHFVDYETETQNDLWPTFLALVKHESVFIERLSAVLTAKLAVWGYTLRMPPNYATDFLRHLKAQVLLEEKAPKYEGLYIAVSCLQKMLIIDSYRVIFYNMDGAMTLSNVFAFKNNEQMQYQIIFCFWLFSYNADLANKLSKTTIVRTVSEIFLDTKRDKVICVSLGFFHNMLENPTEKSLIKSNKRTMVQYGVAKKCKLLDDRDFDDEDILNHLVYMMAEFVEKVSQLFNFPDYVAEVQSGMLSWPPIHKSTKFWLDNAFRLNENNHDIIRRLVRMLETSHDPLTLSLALQDLNQYLAAYPPGRVVLENMNIRNVVMPLQKHIETSVSFEALTLMNRLLTYQDKRDDNPAIKDVEADIF